MTRSLDHIPQMPAPTGQGSMATNAARVLVCCVFICAMAAVIVQLLRDACAAGACP